MAHLSADARRRSLPLEAPMMQHRLNDTDTNCSYLVWTETRNLAEPDSAFDRRVCSGHGGIFRLDGDSHRLPILAKPVGQPSQIERIDAAECCGESAELAFQHALDTRESGARKGGSKNAAASSH